MKPSPILSGLKTYPFVRLTDAKRQLLARGVEVVDFGIGEPREDTPPFIREAVAGALQPKSTYPLADGLPELRAPTAATCSRSTRSPSAPRSPATAAPSWPATPR